jgi:hyperosmotically inducible periplasmic protein
MKRFGVALLLAASAFGAHKPAIEPLPPGAAIDQDTINKLSGEVRRAINKLPYYGVFDDLTYSVDDIGVVTVSGATRTYVVRNSAINAVKQVPGVARVEDKVEVLPQSPYDDNIRVRAYNAIFNYPALSRYAINSRPPIRIIVNRGNVTLDGVVNNELDRTLIENRIRTLGGIFSVTNRLRLDSDLNPPKS